MTGRPISNFGDCARLGLAPESVQSRLTSTRSKDLLDLLKGTACGQRHPCSHRIIGMLEQNREGWEVLRHNPKLGGSLSPWYALSSPLASSRRADTSQVLLALGGNTKRPISDRARSGSHGSDCGP